MGATLKDLRLANKAFSGRVEASSYSKKMRTMLTVLTVLTQTLRIGDAQCRSGRAAGA
jgi:hypothetical protein